MIKRYNDKKNVAGLVIRIERERRGVKPTELCRKLELKRIYINREELYRMEHNQMMIKDFEVVAIFQVLHADLNVLKSFIES